MGHRKSMLTDVDGVVALRDGRVEQDAPPVQLLAVDGFFKQMFDAEAEP